MTLLIRPMTVGDVPAGELVWREACFTVDQGRSQGSGPDLLPRTAPDCAQWVAAAQHLLTTDAAGCWVAEDDGEVVGFVTALRRELLWVLSSFAVAPRAQGRGIGALLLDAGLRHGAGCLRGISVVPFDQGALRRCRKAGFDLHPLMSLRGAVARADLPGVRHVRQGTDADIDLCDSLDRRTRGAAHGADHALLGQQFRRIVMDHLTGQGYAYVTDTGSVACLAADSRRAARALVWEALAASTPDLPVEINCVGAANGWALDVAMAARLEIHPHTYLATRHLKPPAPYIPHSTFL